jgi:hypothetical protein
MNYSVIDLSTCALVSLTSRCSTGDGVTLRQVIRWSVSNVKTINNVLSTVTSISSCTLWCHRVNISPKWHAILMISAKLFNTIWGGKSLSLVLTLPCYPFKEMYVAGEFQQYCNFVVPLTSGHTTRKSLSIISYLHEQQYKTTRIQEKYKNSKCTKWIIWSPGRNHTNTTAMPICFGSETLDSEKNSGTCIIQIWITVTQKRYWCTSGVTHVRVYTLTWVTLHASARWDPFQ